MKTSLQPGTTQTTQTTKSMISWIDCRIVEPFKKRKILGKLGERVHAGEYIQNVRQKYYMKPDGGTVANPRSISHWVLIPDELIPGNGFTSKEWELIQEIINTHEATSIIQMQKQLQNMQASIIPPQIEPDAKNGQAGQNNQNNQKREMEKNSENSELKEDPQILSPLSAPQGFVDQIDPNTWCDVLGQLPPDIIKGSDAHSMLLYDNVTLDDIRKMRARGVLL